MISVERTLPKKIEDHERRQPRTEGAFALKAGYRLADVDGLIHDHVHLELLAVAHLLLDVGDGGLDAVHHLDGVRAGLPVNRDIDCALAVDVHRVGLDRESVFGLADIPHQHRPAVLVLDGDVVEIRHLGDHGVGLDLVVVIADLGGPGGDEHILPTDGLDHVHRREIMGVELVFIGIDQDAAQFPAIDGWGDNPRRS
jgi:hypothetical protein